MGWASEVEHRFDQAEILYQELNRYPRWIQRLLWPGVTRSKARSLNEQIDVLHDVIEFLPRHSVDSETRGEWRSRLSRLDYFPE